MATKYIVIAGAVPALNKRKADRVRALKAKGETVKGEEHVEMHDVFEEDFFLEGEIADLTRGKFIEEYKPYIVTKADLELTAPRKMGDGKTVTVNVNEHHITIHGLTEGDEIHENLKNFVKAPVKKTATSKEVDKEAGKKD